MHLSVPIPGGLAARSGLVLAAEEPVLHFCNNQSIDLHYFSTPSIDATDGSIEFDSIYFSRESSRALSGSCEVHVGRCSTVIASRIQDYSDRA
jgi:hypothetical protein